MSLAPPSNRLQRVPNNSAAQGADTTALSSRSPPLNSMATIGKRASGSPRGQAAA